MILPKNILNTEIFRVVNKPDNIIFHLCSVMNVFLKLSPIFLKPEVEAVLSRTKR